MQDAITQEVLINASKETVYEAVTDPAQLIKWFPDAIEGSCEEGDKPIFEFSGHGKASLMIVSKKPYSYFAYRWVPGNSHFTGDVAIVPNTLVEFFIEDTDSGVKVTVKESGFASLPPEVAQKSFEMNSNGWEFMVNRLAKLFAQN